MKPRFSVALLLFLGLSVLYVSFPAKRISKIIERKIGGPEHYEWTDRKWTDRGSIDKRKVYPFSVVPGGTLTPDELRSRPDIYARKFYGNLNYKTAVMWQSYGESHYNSYRVGNQIYRTVRRTWTKPGERLIKVQRESGEIVFIRARCGNLLIDSTSAPTQPPSREPTDADLGVIAPSVKPVPAILSDFLTSPDSLMHSVGPTINGPVAAIPLNSSEDKQPKLQEGAGGGGGARSGAAMYDSASGSNGWNGGSGWSGGLAGFGPGGTPQGGLGNNSGTTKPGTPSSDDVPPEPQPVPEPNEVGLILLCCSLFAGWKWAGSKLRSCSQPSS